MMAPTKVLLFNSSILGDGGQARALAEAFKVEAAKRDDLSVTERGLVEGKRAVILAARGDQYVGTEMDSQTPHLRHMLGLMGISRVSVSSMLKGWPWATDIAMRRSRKPARRLPR